MKNVIIVGHPLVQQNLALLRDQTTQPQEFRRLLSEIGILMTYEATRSLQVLPLTVETPLAKAKGVFLKREILLIPVLRAGLGMLTGVLQLLPQAKIGFIGLKREEITFKADVYHKSLPPNLKELEIILMDPMLATGGSTLAALDLLAERKARRIRLINLVAAPEGIESVHSRYPDIPIFTAAVDKCLNKVGYIVPGLGDAGDRLFGV